MALSQPSDSGKNSFDLSYEVYFDSNYGKWSRTSETLGAAFPIRKHTEIEPYYEHQNETSKSPNH
jgi:hypothetical protein